MQAAIKKAFGSTATLIGGHSGVFDVVVNGNLIFSKDQTHRFPEDDEVFKAIRELK